MSKQETLEEAAMKMYPIKTDPSGYDINMFSRYGFYNGAKWQVEKTTITIDDAYSEGFENGKNWQAEKMYSEEELQQKIDAHLDVAKDLWLKAAKQVKNLYSEEEVGELVYNIIGEYGKHYGIMIDGSKLNELFEQFKKE